jgi:23S rRNA pseudouridine1911/1915/1917 synthase
MEHKYIVEELKLRLDRYLSGKILDISRSQIQRDIEAGCVFVNGEKIFESKFVVRKNDEIKYQISNVKNQKGIESVNIPLKILYDDNGLLIIDKPAGLVVHPGAGFKGTTLASALLYQFKDIKLVGEEERSGIVHRLDKDTSGVILVAKTQDMYEYLKDAFAKRLIKKEYIALVLGKVEKPHGFIETPIGKSRSDFRKYDTKNIIEPKESLTEYKVIEYLCSDKSECRNVGMSENPIRPTSDSSDLSGRVDPVKSAEGGSPKGKLNRVDVYTLIRVKLHTGRTHQIRVHLNSIKHPLMGDSLYGGKKSQMDGLLRHFLHARKIEVRLPKGEWIEAESDLPDDLRKTLKSLNSKIVDRV